MNAFYFLVKLNEQSRDQNASRNTNKSVSVLKIEPKWRLSSFIRPGLRNVDQEAVSDEAVVKLPEFIFSH